MVDVTMGVKAHPSSTKPRKPDARTERWREHRAAVRADFVDAALRAIDAAGAEVSMGDIAREAGAAKPKLYRHFADKTDLHAALVERVHAMVWERIMLSVNLFEDPLTVLMHRALIEYTTVVDEHPNWFRFLVHSHFTAQAAESDRALDTARTAARRMASLFADGAGLDSMGAELVAYSVFGAVGSATDWWLGANRASPRSMPVTQYVDYLCAVVTGIIVGSSSSAGLTIDITRPVHLAFGTDVRAGGTP